MYSDREYTDKVKDMIENTLNRYSTTPSETNPNTHYFKPPEDILAIIIFCAKNIAIQHSTLCKRNKTETYKNLQDEIKHTQNLLDTLPTTPDDLLLKLESLKTEQSQYLDSISQKDYMEKLQYDYLNLQRPGKEFPKPQFFKQSNFSEHYTTINNKPTLIKSQKATETHIHNFYKNLFAHKECKDDPSSVKDFLNGISLKQETLEENETLAAPIKAQEVAEFIKQCQIIKHLASLISPLPSKKISGLK